MIGLGSIVLVGSEPSGKKKTYFLNGTDRTFSEQQVSCDLSGDLRTATARAVNWLAKYFGTDFLFEHLHTGFFNNHLITLFRNPCDRAALLPQPTTEWLTSKFTAELARSANFLSREA
jgi:hypothetical protein